MNFEKVKDAISVIDALILKVGAVRDELDDKMMELNEIRDDCEGAYDCLTEARDRLSELV